MKYVSIIALVFCVYLMGCNKNIDDNNASDKDTTQYPIDTTFGKARLFASWELRSSYQKKFKNGLLIIDTSQLFVEGSMNLKFRKEDSLIVKLHDTLFDAKFTVSKNVIFVNPKIFNNVFLDSMTFKFDTYKLILSTVQKSIDANNDTIAVFNSYLLTP